MKTLTQRLNESVLNEAKKITVKQCYDYIKKKVAGKKIELSAYNKEKFTLTIPKDLVKNAPGNHEDEDLVFRIEPWEGVLSYEFENNGYDDDLFTFEDIDKNILYHVK